MAWFKGRLPEIRFFEGSIEWEGIISIFNIMATVSGAIAFGEYVRQICSYAINRAIKNNVPPHLRHAQIETVSFVEEDSFPQNFQPIQSAAPTVQNGNYLPQIHTQYPYPVFIQQPANNNNTNETENSQSRLTRILIATTFFNTALVGALLLLLVVSITNGKL